MRRLHLFEFGDLRWFPKGLRDAETAYLAAAYWLFPLAQPWAGKERTLHVLIPADRSCATGIVTESPLDNVNDSGYFYINLLCSAGTRFGIANLVDLLKSALCWC
jgi:hypothetical protein